MARKAATPKFSKTCTKSGETFTVDAVEDFAEFFYRDKSQKDGFSPWCKAAEKAYNKAYREGLKNAEVNRKKDADEAQVEVFEAAMVPERVTRGTHKANRTQPEAPKVVVVKAAPAKKAPAKKAPVRRTRSSRKAA